MSRDSQLSSDVLGTLNDEGAGAALTARPRGQHRRNGVDMEKRNASSSATPPRLSLGRWTGDLFPISADALVDPDDGHVATHLLVCDSKGGPIPGAQIVVWHGGVDGVPRAGRG